MKRFISVFLIVMSIFTSLGCKEIMSVADKNEDKVIETKKQNYYINDIDKDKEYNVIEDKEEEIDEEIQIDLDKNYEKEYTYGKYDVDNNFFINLSNEKTNQYSSGIGGMISPNKKYLITGEKTGLYYTNTKNGEKTLICDKYKSLYGLVNKGVFYVDSDSNLHRYFFNNNDDLNLGKINQIINKEYDRVGYSTDLSIVYEDDSIIYLLKSNENEKIAISRINKSCEIVYVSEDANTIIWNDCDDYEIKVYMYRNGDKDLIGTFYRDDDYPNYTPYIKINADKDVFVLLSATSDYFYIIPKDRQPIKVNLDYWLATSSFYTERGLFDFDIADEFAGLYVTARSDKYHNYIVYFINENGEKQQVVLVKMLYGIFDGYIYYRDRDNNLVIAKVNRSSTSEKKIITSDVMSENKLNMSGCLYYAKDYNYEVKYVNNFDDDFEDSKYLDTGDLYAYKKDYEPIKIASDVSCYYNDGNSFCITSIINTEEDTIYFYKDVEYYKEIKANNTEGHYTGTLYKYSYGDDEPLKIASDVVLGTITSGLASGKIDNNSFTYIRYTDIYNNRIIGDWCYYNGKESIKMAENIYA